MHNNNHQHHPQHSQEPPHLSRKPPRPPPISLSQPSNPNPNPTAPPAPEPTTPFSDLDSPLTPQFETPRDQQPPPLPPRAQPSPPTKPNNSAGAIVAVEKFYSPLASPAPLTPPNNDPVNNNNQPPCNQRQQIVRFKSKDDTTPPHVGGEGNGKLGFGYGYGYGDGGDADADGVRDIGGGPTRGFKKGRVGAMSKVALGIRVLEMGFCLVSFAVMATDRTQGWTGDSFYRYKEYRFCLTVNIIGFVYAGFQAINLAYHVATGSRIIKLHLCYQLVFVMDQIIAYLLISASSAAATRVVDWELNWGKDEFTKKASVSISVAFLAFLTFALSSLISGYNLCNSDVS